jgi:VCBS repeat-containing protein
MFVGGHIESGDECKAAAALRSQVIGHIQTAVGEGSVRRASGIAVQAMVGDAIYQGDVIETAADGRIGIRFIDDTVFSLSHDTRLVLDEFVCDDGASHSALVTATRGSFAFIAGQLAKTGSLRIDTPVGMIRGRGHAGGFGMLTLTALTFAILPEAQAADSNVTLLDDDSITYKDLPHGAFELVTKEAIPRHIIVEDPGETVVLSARGSSVSVIANTPARMEELHAAQQDVLANYARELGHAGSSSLPLFEAVPGLEPINFIQSDDAPEQGSLPPLPSSGIIVPEIILIRAPATPPTLTIATGPVETDTVVFDTFTATSGTFSGSSANGAPLTFGISGGTVGSTVLDGVTYDVSSTAPHGTLYVASTTGAYTFVPDSGAINALTAPTTDSFVITVSDGTLSANQTFTINIDGVNDAAIIHGTATGSVIEAGTAPSGTLSVTGGVAPGAATGTLTDTDVDNAHNTFIAVTSPTASAGGHGTFTMTAAGVWTYTPNEANHDVQALNVGDTLTDSFTVNTEDGTPQVVTITIHGSNDAAVISGTTASSVVEAGSATPGTPIATGTLTDTDVDNTPNSFAAVGSPTAGNAGYGTFTMTAAGVWTYTVDNHNSAVQALNVGHTLTDSFTVTTVDGTPQLVTVIIQGANDAAVISGTTTGSVIEAGYGHADRPVATGMLSDTDVDNAPNTFTAVNLPTASAGGYGTFMMTAAGAWTYTLDNHNGAVQALNDCDTLTDSFTVTTIDGTAQLVTVIIHGTNDAAIISGTTAGSVIDAGTPIATGTLTDTDVDNTPNTFMAVSCPTPSDAHYGAFTMTTGGVWTYTLDHDNCAVQALNACDTLTDSFTVTTVDGTPQQVTITIQGSNDAAIISGTTTGSVIEASCGQPDRPTATGLLCDTDVDNPPDTFTAVNCPTASAGGYGTFMMTAAGVWTYTLDNANGAVQALNYCDTLTDSFTVTTIDGTPQLVTIAIHGTNDAAVISGTTTGSVIEAGCADPGTPVATGTLTDTDVDNVPNTFTAVSCPTPSDTHYGAFTMTAAGAWTYTLDNDNCTVQALNACDTLTDCFTVTTVDGTAQVVTVTIQGTNDADPRDFNAGAHLADDNRPAQATNLGFKFGAASDQIALSDHASSASSDTVRTHPTDSTSDGAIAPMSGQSIALLGDSFHFKAEISGPAAPAVIGLAEAGHDPLSMIQHENAARTSGPPAISEQAQTTALSPPGHDASDKFSIVSDHAAPVVVTHVLHDLMV